MRERQWADCVGVVSGVDPSPPQVAQQKQQNQNSPAPRSVAMSVSVSVAVRGPEKEHMEAGNDSASADAAATAAPAEAAQAVPAQAPTPTPWFNDWAASKGIDQFSRLLGDAGLTTFVESCETPLTIFAPTNEAIMGLGSTLPTDTQLLRELLCVHITMGSLRYIH